MQKVAEIIGRVGGDSRESLLSFAHNQQHERPKAWQTNADTTALSAPTTTVIARIASHYKETTE
ncbi:MAG: hypothetical protein C4319_05750 [Acidimicrobiia bacterium]